MHTRVRIFENKFVIFVLVFLASVSASLSSLALSKTLYRGTSVGGYLSVYFLSGFLISSFLNGMVFSHIPMNCPMTLLGIAVGFLISILMFVMGKALQNGPSGLTFSFQNSGAILSPLLLAFIFKKPFGFSLSFENCIGMILVILGLFWAAVGHAKMSVRKTWIAYALVTFIVQGLILSIFQWRCLLFQEDLPAHVLIPFSCPSSADLWFMPALFFSAWVCQALCFSYSERRLPSFPEIVGGSFGGIANGLSTFLLLKATRFASLEEKTMLFPFFTVIVVLLCNLYGRIFFHEKIKWKANALAVLGIFIGTAF
jgi:hypothetical protein